MTAPPAVHVLARVELGGMLIGIPADAVLRVLPRPARLTRLPRSHGAIDGVFRDGDQLVAVLDLRQWMAQPPVAGATPAQVMLLGAGGRTVGLAVDAVHGLVRVRAAGINRIHHDDCADGFFHSVATLDDATLLSLLDPAVLIAQAAAWAPGADLSTATHRKGRAARSGPAQALALVLVRMGAVTLALPASMVAEIVRPLPAQAVKLGGAAVTGMVRWRGRLTPVLDPARSVLALAGGHAYTVILEQAGTTLAVPVDAVLAVRSFSAAQVQDAATAGLDASLYLGCARGADGGAVLLADAAALLARYAVAGLDEATRPPAHGTRHARAPAHVVYDAGQLGAAPMHTLLEIVALPGDYRAPPGLAAGLDGQCDWRGRTLPVIDLRTPAARHARARACLMVVRDGERELGLLVKDVVALLPANAAVHTRFALPGGQAVEMITVGRGAQQASYRVLDVALLAA